MITAKIAKIIPITAATIFPVWLPVCGNLPELVAGVFKACCAEDPGVTDAGYSEFNNPELEPLSEGVELVPLEFTSLALPDGLETPGVALGCVELELEACSSLAGPDGEVL